MLILTKSKSLMKNKLCSIKNIQRFQNSILSTTNRCFSSKESKQSKSIKEDNYVPDKPPSMKKVKRDKDKYARG